MPSQSTAPRYETQNARRVKYGLNTAVAVIAAVALVVLMNWIAYRQFVRFDLTATRQYSLSEQTRQLLKNLPKPHTIVTLLPPGTSAAIEQARDLTDEYARYGKGNLTVEHLEIGRSITQTESFYKSITDRYDAQLKPVAAAVETGQKTLKSLREQSKQQTTLLASLIQSGTMEEGELKQTVGAVVQALKRLDSQTEQVQDTLDKSLRSPLPDYGAAKETLGSLVREIDEKIYAIALNRFEKAAQSASTSNQARETLLQVTDSLKLTRRELGSAKEAISSATVSEDYDKLRGQLDRASAGAVVILGSSKIQVLPLEQMFREATAEQQQAGNQRAELQFLGEELISGALLAMNLENPPLVVFVSTGRRPALGPQGEYGAVAQRLRNMNLTVEEWNPMGRPGPMGQPMPGGPPPQPKPGQKAVWVLLPGEPANPMMGMMNSTGPAVEKIQERLAAGDAALVMPVWSPMGALGGPADPLIALLEPYRITPQLDRVVLREDTGPRGVVRANNQMSVNRWPDSFAVSKTLGNMSAIFLQTSPMTLGESKGDDVKVWPLVEITGKNLWAERNLGMNQNPKRDPTTAAEKFIIGAAAEKKGGGRIIAVSDPAWATDQLISYGLLGQGTAELTGAAFPGNAELFVNSIYWLSGMEQYLAAGARSQDIRRIEPIDPYRLYATKWGLPTGMVLAIFGTGIGVWLIRRRG